MFLLTPFFMIIYFWLLDNLKIKKDLLSYLIPFLLYIFVAGLQYEVGTDYNSYIDIYSSDYRLSTYFDKGEIGFYYLFNFLKWFDLHYQSLFFAFSIVNGFIFFCLIDRLKEEGCNIVLFLFLFFVVTNIYQNQLNGLRQFVGVLSLPLFLHYIFSKSYFKSLLVLFLAVSFHLSAIIFLVFYFLKLLNFYVKNLFFYFVFSFFFYYLFDYIFPFILGFIDQSYLFYFEYDFESNLVAVLSKLYYLPGVILFYYLYGREFYRNSFTDSKYFKFCVFIFTVTYWSFILIYNYPIFGRLFYYFSFFYVFPFYYVLFILKSHKNMMAFYFTLVYLALPYILKVTLFAKSEFLYKSFIFN
jgi:hypothetical protein